MSTIKSKLQPAVSLALVAAVCASCASRPDDIQATYVSPLEYADYNCKQVGQELGRVSRRVAEVSGQQNDTADEDAAAMGVGLILFWPALFFLAGGDHSDELGRLKGEYDALEQAAIQKECSVAADIEEARRLREQQEAEAAAVQTGPTYLGAGQTARP